MDDEANAVDNLTEEEGNTDSNKSASSTILCFWVSVTSLDSFSCEEGRASDCKQEGSYSQ